jgi:hypothetical protein
MDLVAEYRVAGLHQEQVSALASEQVSEQVSALVLEQESEQV